MKIRLLAIPAAAALGIAAFSLTGSASPAPTVAVTPQAAPSAPVALEVAPQGAAPVEDAPAPAEQVVAPEPAPEPAPAEVPVVWPIPSAPVVAGPWSVCEVVHADGYWGVYGATSLPRGTVFTFTIDSDEGTRTIPLVARAGSIVIGGVLYGHADGYVDDGTNTNFGTTSADMPYATGPVTATVTLDGAPVC